MPAPARPPTSVEFMVVGLARELATLGHVAVGAQSPIPAAAALLAQSWAKAAGHRPMRVSILGSEIDNPFTDGGRELFDCAGQGRIDAFFLSGGQIDGAGNINLVGAGPDPLNAPAPRFPGSFGSAYLYFVVPKVILFREEHSPRTLVEKVDFISAPGTSPPGVYRPGGPAALVTSLARFQFDRAHARFVLRWRHPSVSAQHLKAATGFSFHGLADAPEMPTPPMEQLELLRGPVAARLAGSYGAFAEREWGAAKSERPSATEPP